MFAGGLTGALFVQLNYKITLFRRRYSVLYINTIDVKNINLQIKKNIKHVF